MELKLGSMDRSMKGTMCRGKSKDMGLTHELMALFMKENGTRTR
jgi:hypothetical protein